MDDTATALRLKSKYWSLNKHTYMSLCAGCIAEQTHAQSIFHWVAMNTYPRSGPNSTPRTTAPRLLQRSTIYHVHHRLLFSLLFRILDPSY